MDGIRNASAQVMSVPSHDNPPLTVTAWEMAAGTYRLTGFLLEDPAAGTARAWVNDNGTIRAATDRVFRGPAAWDDAWDHLAELREIYERKFLAHLKPLRGR